jgi:tetratricopeptide (TPR) repeat protein
VLQFAGKLAEANVAARRAYEANTYLADADAIVLILFDTSLELRRFDEAEQWCDRGQATFPNNWRFCMCQLSLLAWSPAVRPEVPKAWRTFARLDSLASPDERPWLLPQMRMIVASVLAAAGRRDSAERVIASVNRDASGDLDLLYYEALARVRLGQPAAAARLIEAMLRRVPNYRPFLRSHPEFEGLWDDPGLRTLAWAHTSGRPEATPGWTNGPANRIPESRELQALQDIARVRGGVAERPPR